MKSIFFYFLIGMTLSSCNNAPNDNIERLLELDSLVQLYPTLRQFTSLKLYTKDINGVPICDSSRSKCKPNETHYASVLDSIGVPVSTFDSLTNRVDDIGFIKYYRYDDYSVWVENGAFGDIYGYLINHKAEISDLKSFKIDNRYHIGIGKKIRPNVYYFSSNFD